MLQAGNIDLQPVKAPITVAAMGDVDAGVDGNVFTEKERHTAGITHVDVEIIWRFDQHAFEGDIQQVTAPLLVAALH